MNLGLPEIVLIFVAALVFFGPKKLPEIGRSLGQFMREIKRASNSLIASMEDGTDEDRRALRPPVTKDGEA